MTNSNKNQNKIQFDYVYEYEEDYGIRIIFIEKKTLKIEKETWLNSFVDELDMKHLELYLEHMLSKLMRLLNKELVN